MDISELVESAKQNEFEYSNGYHVSESHEKVLRFISQLTGPETIFWRSKMMREGLEHFFISYGGLCRKSVRVNIIPRESGLEYSAEDVGGFSNSVGITVGKELPEDWRSRLCEYLERAKEDLFDERPGREEQYEAIREAARRSEELKAETVSFHDRERVVGFLLGEDEEWINLRLTDLGGSALGRCSSENDYIALDLEALAQSMTRSEPSFESNEQRIYLRTLETALHEMGHAVNHHGGSDQGFGDNDYCWEHELEACAYVSEHAQTELEAEAFEVWTMSTLRSYHYD